MSNAAFRASFGKRMDVAAEKLDAVARAAAEEVARRVVLKSPVDTGRFRANWNLSFQAPDTSTRDSSANDAPARAAAKLTQYRTGQTIYITNGLPYAGRLEFDGWSKQAPAGMVRITAAEFPAIVRRAIRGLA